MIVAIDGPSGTGKSTVARRVAEKLGFDYLDTGAMYRSLAVLVYEQGIDPTDLESIEALCTDFHCRSQFDGQWRFFLGEREVTDEIRSSDATRISSQIAAYPFVRRTMAALQRQHAKRNDLVCEGRDIGTVIFPDAELKVFLTASPDVRAQRRYEEMKKRFPDQECDFDEIKSSIIQRDSYDANREHSPLKQAEDAVLIDTSGMTIDQVIDAVIQRVKS